VRLSLRSGPAQPRLVLIKCDFVPYSQGHRGAVRSASTLSSHDRTIICFRFSWRSHPLAAPPVVRGRTGLRRIPCLGGKIRPVDYHSAGIRNTHHHTLLEWLHSIGFSVDHKTLAATQRQPGARRPQRGSDSTARRGLKSLLFHP